MDEEYKKLLDKIMNTKSQFRVENSAENEAVIYIYGYIGGWENSAERIKDKIGRIESETIHVHINSGGGSAFDGIAIGNMLKQHKAEIIIHIDGWAASAASIIAMAGDVIIMPSNTMMMIHQASTFAYGNADEFEKEAKMLRKVDKAVTASYQQRFVGSEEELTELLKEETWLNADEAVALGLADEVADEIEIVETDDDDDDVEEYENTKEKLVAKYAANAKRNKVKEKEPTSEPVQNRNVSRLFLIPTK